MWRWAWHGLTAACVAVAVATVGVWVASAVVGTRLDYTDIDRSANPLWTSTAPYVESVPHRLTVGLMRVHYDRRLAFAPLASITPPGLTWRETTPARADVADLRNLLGFATTYHRFPDTGFGQGWTASATVPDWFVAAAAGVLPAWRAWAWARRRRRPATACRGCGYDLRASTGRCPECGRPDPAGVGHR